MVILCVVFLARQTVDLEVLSSILSRGDVFWELVLSWVFFFFFWPRSTIGGLDAGAVG